MTEQKRIEEARREAERQRMNEQRIIEKCLLELEQGSISEFDIEEWMKMVCSSTPMAERLAMQVNLAYAERRPSY